MRRVLAVVTVLLPVVILLTLTVTYLVAPGFYLTYVLHPDHRETQAVEIATFAGLLLAGLLFVPATVTVWRGTRLDGGGRRDWGGWLAVGVVASLAAAALFTAGEEIDWGDSYGLYGEQRRGGSANKLNLHNASVLPVKSIGNVYLAVVFFALPGLWLLRRRLNLPASLGRAVPPWPVVVAMGVAAAWREVKDVYRSATGDVGERRRPPAGIYWDFIEQINEHKELLIAVAFVCFALYLYLPPREDDTAVRPPPEVA